MKFAEVLNTKMTTEWRSQYYYYEFGKGLLASIKEDVANADPPEMDAIIESFEHDFFEFNERELEKIDAFYQEKLNEAKRKQIELSAQLDEFLKHKQQQGKKGRRARRSTYGSIDPTYSELNRVSVTIQDFQFAFSEFYLNLILIQNFQQLNLTAFRKILKKHDKVMANTQGAKWREEFVLKAVFATSKEIDNMIVKVENDVTVKLEGGDRKRAMAKLRVPPLGQPHHSAWTVLRIGIWCGSLMVLFAIAGALVPWSLCDPNRVGCWRDSCNPANNYTDIDPGEEPEFWEVTIRLYRGIYLLALMFLLLGINFHGWAASGINHVLIFELDPRDHLSSFHLIEIGFAFIALATVSLVVWLCQFYLAYVFHIHPVYIRYAAFAFFLLFFVLLLNPIPIFLHKSRFWLLKVLFRIITAPFHSVCFADFWLADQFTSLVPVFQDFVFVICCCSLQFNLANVEHVCDDRMFLVMSILGCLPAWFRFAQCIRRYYDSGRKHPHLTNAGKYSTTFLVIIFRSLHAVWDKGGFAPAQPVATTSATLVPFTSSMFPLANVTTTTPVPVFNVQNPFLYCWIAAGTLSTIYTYIWDVKMDWGLLAPNAGENRFLREHIVFQHRWYYYVAIVVDLILRLSWTLTVADFEISKEEYITDIFITSLTFVEMFRRFVWNFFRLENEHVNNVGEFRAVRDISIKPIHETGECDLPSAAENTGEMSQADVQAPTPKTPNISWVGRLKRWWHGRVGSAQSGEYRTLSGVFYESYNNRTSLVPRPSKTTPGIEVEVPSSSSVSVAVGDGNSYHASVQVHESFARSRMDSTYRYIE